MAYSTGISFSISGNGVNSISSSLTITSDNVENFQITVPVGADLHVDFQMTLAVVLAYCFQADGALRMETNTGVGTGTAGETFDLEADTPLFWYDGIQLSKHFTDDVDELYLTNTGEADVTLNIVVARDVTV